MASGIAPIEFPPPVNSEKEFIGGFEDAEDERIEVGVAIVGGGPAGLACANRLMQLLAENESLMERLGAQAELADVVKGLQERVEHLAAMPDDRKSPLLNGQIGGGAPAGDDPFVHLQKAVDDAKSESERAQAQAALAHARVKARFSR